MADSTFMAAPEESAVVSLWRQQSIWSQTANRIKGGLTRWRVVALALTVAGAVLATLGTTFATVRHRTKVTEGPGSRAAGLAMAFKRIESAQDRWRAAVDPAALAQRRLHRRAAGHGRRHPGGSETENRSDPFTYAARPHDSSWGGKGVGRVEVVREGKREAEQARPPGRCTRLSRAATWRAGYPAGHRGDLHERVGLWSAACKEAEHVHELVGEVVR